MSPTKKPTKNNTYLVHYINDGKKYKEEYEGRRLSFFQVGESGSTVFQIIDTDGDEVFTCDWDFVFSVKKMGSDKKELRSLSPADIVQMKI